MKGLALVLLAAACLSFAGWFGAHDRSDRLAGSAVVLGADAPPGVRFVTVALGGFRGLLADLLWVRASDLQEKGNFFEVAQLADWITRLEPRYPEVWSYHAWNMAYNITAVVPDPGDRWHWVMNGVRLLRDEGIPANPHDPKLHWELGWMFYDKVGGRWDEATLFYRISWAREVSSMVGAGMLNHTLIAAHPEAVRALAAVGMDAETMKRIDDDYGPLDWRLPETHALYWGVRGQPYQKPDSRWCDRLVWMSLTETLKGGMLAFSPERKLYQQAPRLEVAVKGIPLCTKGTLFNDPLTGLVAAKFLRESALYLYAFGRKAEAESALQELKRSPGYTGGEVSLDAFARHEVAQGEGLVRESKRERVVGFLKKAELWERLDVKGYREGFTTLARLCWESWAKDDGPVVAWDTLVREAHELAVRDMP